MPNSASYQITLTAGITAAYAAGNHLPAHALPDVLTAVYRALCGLAATSAPAECSTALTPAQIQASIQPGGIVSFIDGRSYKTLKRHLRAHGLDPHGYRTRFGLPTDYPMVAPSYAARRSEIAREIQLGQLGGAARRASATA